jgi:hypothetical protein
VQGQAPGEVGCAPGAPRIGKEDAVSKPKVPNTISGKKMRELQERARKADREPVFSQRNVARRKADNDQRSKSRWS